MFPVKNVALIPLLLHFFLLLPRAHFIGGLQASVSHVSGWGLRRSSGPCSHLKPSARCRWPRRRWRPVPVGRVLAYDRGGRGGLRRGEEIVPRGAAGRRLGVEIGFATTVVRPAELVVDSRSISVRQLDASKSSAPHASSHTHRARPFGRMQVSRQGRRRAQKQRPRDQKTMIKKTNTYCFNSALICSASPPAAVGTLVSAAHSRMWCPSSAHWRSAAQPSV